MARPTKYNKKLQARADKYVESCLLNSKKFPTIEDLALLLDLDEDTVLVWATESYPDTHKQAGKLKKPLFSGTYKKVKVLQKRYLQRNGLTGKTNAAVSIFLLKVNHGLVETTKVDQTVTGEVSFVNDVPRPRQ